MEKKLTRALLFFMLTICSVGYGQQPAIINIKVEDFGYLQIQDFSFFTKKNEFVARKDGEGSYTLSYFGKQPKLLSINLRGVLISPGDNVQLTYKTLDANPDHYRDTIIATGTNVGNYVFSNFHKHRPKGFYVNPDLERYKNNPEVLYADLQNKYTIYEKKVYQNLTAIQTNSDLISYLQRQLALGIIFDMIAYEQKYKAQNELKRAKVYSELADSLFDATQFIAADTAYMYTMETLFKKQFPRVLSKFNMLKAQGDFDRLIAYIKNYKNEFVRDWFVYFLATDYVYLTTNYPSAEFKRLVSLNKNLKRERFDFMIHNGVVK